MPIITKNGIQYNVNPNAIGASELTVTTPEVKVIGKAPLFNSRQSAFNRNELIQDADKILGNTIGKVIEPITRIPGVTPILRTLTPSNWVGTIRTGAALWSENNEGFGTSENDQALNSLFNYGVTPSIGSPILKSRVSTLGKVTNSTFNKLRNYVLSRHLNNNIKRWDGTVGIEYFNSPNNWYRWTETPEIEGIREMGKNITTRDAIDINVPSNNWRTAAMDNYSKSKEGYWYKADIPNEDMSLREQQNYVKNNTNKPIGFNKKYGSAHGNKTQAAYGKAWDGSISASGIGQLGLLEGPVGIQIPFGKTRTSFTLTPIEEVPIGGRVGFSTGEMPMDNLGWFTKLPNGRFKYNGQVLPYKRIEILKNQ